MRIWIYSNAKSLLEGVGIDWVLSLFFWKWCSHAVLTTSSMRFSIHNGNRNEKLLSISYNIWFSLMVPINVFDDWLSCCNVGNRIILKFVYFFGGGRTTILKVVGYMTGINTIWSYWNYTFTGLNFQFWYAYLAV